MLSLHHSDTGLGTPAGDKGWFIVYAFGTLFIIGFLGICVKHSDKYKV